MPLEVARPVTAGGGRGATSLRRDDGAAAVWAVERAIVAYPQAVAAMEGRAEAIARGEAPELVWLMEHPPLYTAGVSARAEDLLEPGRLPVFRTGRGGRFTYHGPGQRVGYVMLDLRRRGGDVRAFVAGLERWLIGSLARLGVAALSRPGRVGVWVERSSPPRDEKIAAIGVRLRRWVSFHGVSLNVCPDLSHFAGIVPCGLTGLGVTSLADLGLAIKMREVDDALESAFVDEFGAVIPGDSPMSAEPAPPRETTVSPAPIV